MDIHIATTLNDLLKTSAGHLARSATETTNEQLRQMLAQASQSAIDTQYNLYRFMNEKGWYRPVPAREEDIDFMLPQLQAMQGSPAVTVS